MASNPDEKPDRALKRQIEENLRLEAARKLGPPPARLVTLVEELAKALSERFPQK